MSSPHSAPCSDLNQRLQQLQSHFTWDLKEDDVDLEDLSARLNDHIDLELGHQGAAARSSSLLAYVRFLQGRPEEALSLLHRSEEMTRKYYGEENEWRLIVTYGNLAWLKYHGGDFEESESFCRRVEDVLAASPAERHHEVYGEKGWSYLKFSRNHYTKAVDCFRRALELQPDDSEWNAGCAIVLYRLEPRSTTDRDVESSPAVKQLRLALKINPDDGALLSLLALSLLSFEQLKEAEGLVERALTVDPENPHVVRYVGKFLRIQGQTSRSIQLLKGALQRSSESAFIHHQLALCYKKQRSGLKGQKHVKQKEVDQLRELCLHHLSEAVRIRPSFVIALLDLAQLYLEEKNLSRAEELFQQGLKNLDSDKHICQIFFLRYADFHLHHRKQEAEAVAHYTEALTFVKDTFEWTQSVKVSPSDLTDPRPPPSS
ncbi:interferon-induced protein with tetratricopeptide repeats 5-like [Xyrichtys novacula]|uniref:Interferon-induced protein with tetratricopeptide repeats 5-like n=1 Tax=Xyrichtys novacula TaxID=13765 RepID=A0AAV1H797_XYRNO|nr:interferon-induced protein with tetratricopeptide repeats 5-like [Xyrichtys novacula]